jgi:hypothetical protein
VLSSICSISRFDVHAPSPIIQSLPSLSPHQLIDTPSYYYYRNMTSKASIFRAIAHSRKTCRRFQPDRKIPETTLQDILHTTLVRAFHVMHHGNIVAVKRSLLLLYCSSSEITLQFQFAAVTNHSGSISSGQG